MSKVNRYTLSIIEPEKEPFVFEKTSLDYIDAITTKFKNEKELIATLGNILDKEFDLSTTKTEVTYSHCKKIKKVEKLYFNDILILDREATKKYILDHMNNKSFVVKFVSRYNGSNYFIRFKKDIILKINKGEDYTDTLFQLLDVVFANYKSLRDAYLFTKKHGKIMTKEKEEISKSKEEQIKALKMLKEGLYYQYTLGNWSDELERNNISLSKVKK
ncbi:MAG TPA: hypothetical protein GX725_00310 [Mollicutes bacterium]|jgi:hypothetical protein|nr:hypothetical protein [Mollicutes bacterium]